MLTGVGALAADLAVAGVSPATLFLAFLAFSFAGWLYESTICALANYGHFANSGFLLGPCCPIYGVGALACWLLLRDVRIETGVEGESVSLYACTREQLEKILGKRAVDEPVLFKKILGCIRFQKTREKILGQTFLLHIPVHGFPISHRQRCLHYIDCPLDNPRGVVSAHHAPISNL